MKVTAVALCALVSAMAAGVAGCARSAEERQLDAMREEIDHLQHERDREDSRAGLMGTDEGDGTPATPGRPGAPPSAASSEPVAIGTDDQPAPDDLVDPEDPTPRPSIRILGTARPAGRGAWRGEDHVEQSGMADNGTAGAGEERPSALDPEAKPAYDAALALVTAHKYDAALDALAAFLVKWPDHPYADNAMYWRGECYFARGDYAHAAEQFEGVLTRFPAGNKAPDALLKLGMCAARTGDAARAKELYARLARDYPQSAAARHIPPATAGATAPGPSPEDHR
jgi:tol-pal system protein YbgF